MFPFSANLSSLEVLHLVALASGAAGVDDFGVQRYRYNPGVLEQLTAQECKSHCDQSRLTGQGDRYFCLVDRDVAAERSRLEDTLEHPGEAR